MRQKILGLSLFFLVVAILSGAFFYGYYYGKPGNVQDQTVGSATDPLNVIKNLEKQAQGNPNNLSITETLGDDYFDLASSLRNNGDTQQSQLYFAKAAATYSKVMASEPTRVDVQTDMATALYYSNQPDQAEAAYKKAIQINPNYLNARLNYGIFLLYVRGDTTGARKELFKAMSLQPSSDTLTKIRSILAQTDATTVSPSTSGTPDWSKDIEPVIFQACAAQCHGPGGTMAQAPLQDYNAVMKFVTPGDINSPLLQRIKDGHGVKLDAATIELIQRWVAGGAPGPKSGS
ncbi:MAG: tetratricopeptide repeat protein [Peptococcaceae bacterium]|nr:tetratricopeptide repeat protein [Peptococcaceae bacterium]